MIEKSSPEHEILAVLCDMPRPLRGVSEEVLLGKLRSPRAIHNIVSHGLIRLRGWSDGLGGVWVPTSEGENPVIEFTAVNIA